MTEFTRGAVIKAAREIVAEKGEDYIYPDFQHGCTYSTYGDVPSCIVGYIVNRIDPVFFQEIANMESDGDPDSDSEDRAGNSFAANELNELFDAGIDEDVLASLRAAQIIQDSGKTWGEALQRLEV